MTMRAWMLCLLIAILGGCAKKSADSQPSGGQAFTCDASVHAQAVNEIPTDPFLERGKVQLESESSTRFSTLAGSDNAIDADTELSVTVREKCPARGVLSLAIKAQFAERYSAHARTRSGVRSFLLRLPFPTTVDELRRLADADRCIVGIAGKHLSKLSDLPIRGPADELLSDPLVKSQAHLSWLQASGGYDLIYTQDVKRPVVVAVIDTGMDLRHEDLSAVLWKNPGEIPGNKIDDDKNGYIDDVHGFNFATRNGDPSYSTSVKSYQHGTHVSGLAAAPGGTKVGGSGVMASGAKIMTLNVFEPKSSGAESSDIADAIRYAADNGADVINISLGGEGKSATYEAALAYAIGKGVAIFVAAGNSHRELGPSSFMSPAGYAMQFDGMIAVASLDTASSELSSFSNYSTSYVELAAPGSENSRSRLGLLSTYPESKYARSQGTSMSSPVVAGGAAVTFAMMWARGYEPGAATIEKLLEASALQLGTLRSYVRGGRALNLKMLAEYIDKNYPRNSGAPSDPGVPGFKPCGD